MAGTLNPYSSEPRKVREMFEGIACHYDLANRLLSFYRDVSWRQVVKSHLNSQRLVLDLCCGTGDLVRAVSNGSNIVLGLDFSGNMLRIAKGRAACGKSYYIQADAMHLPFKSNSFDAITIAFGIRNLKDAPSGLEEMGRVLQSSGHLFVLEFSRPESPLVSKLYHFYLSMLVPFIGRMVTGTRAYQYLFKTIDLWPSGTKFIRIMEEAGFRQVKAHPLTFGVATLYWGKTD